MNTPTPFLKRHAVSIAVTAVAAVFAVLLAPVHLGVSFAVFIVAVLVVAWPGGPAPALAVTGFAAAALAGICARLPDGAGEQLVRMGLFVLVGVLASYLGRECRRAVRSVDLLHDTLSTLSEALVFTDAEGRVTFLNPHAQSLTGLTPA